MVRIEDHMNDKCASAEELQEIMDLTRWSVRDLAQYWDCTAQTIYQWLENGKVTRGIATWAVRKTLEEVRAQHAPAGRAKKALASASG
jgi:hypothetical protein